MKKLLAFALVAGIPAASSLVYVVNPALATGPKIITSKSTVDFLNFIPNTTKSCTRTDNGQTSKIFIQSQAFRDSENLNLTSIQTCINRDLNGVITDVLYDASNTKLSM